MQKSLLAFLSCSTLVLISCSLLGKYNEVEYNNMVLSTINATSLAIENTSQVYNETIPNVVTEETEIDTKTMQSAYDDALSQWETTEDLLTIESQNLEQQNAVQGSLSSYRNEAESYLNSYATMMSYYTEESYKEDLSQVEVLDENLHEAYLTFIKANNALVDILEGFVAPGEEL